MLTAAMRLAVHRDGSAATLGAGGDAAVEMLLWFTGTPPHPPLCRDLVGNLGVRLEALEERELGGLDGIWRNRLHRPGQRRRRRRLRPHAARTRFRRR
jgi:hypothetical protein